MPYPSKPEIATSYTAFEQSQGDGSFPGQELDVDLRVLRDRVSDLVDFVRGITRSDGKLANGSVTQDALAASIRLGFDPPAPWAAETAYTTRSTAFESYGFYLCLVDHTSGSDFATDLSAGRWQLLADLTPPDGALQSLNNLSDVGDAAAARGNLGLGTMSTQAAGTGSSEFRTNDQNDARFVRPDATSTISAVQTFTAQPVLDAGAKWNDNDAATFGTGNDFTVTHNGTNTVLVNVTGGLFLDSRGGDFFLRTTSDEIMIRANRNAGVLLNFDNATKMETTSAGATVTGTLNATTNLTIDGADVATEAYADAAAAAVAIGVGQTPQNVAASRALATTYENTTGRPIQLTITAVSSAGSGATVNLLLGATSGGVEVVAQQSMPSGSFRGTISGVIVPAGWFYRLNTDGGSPTVVHWWEMRA
jgi:hypothetical protein